MGTTEYGDNWRIELGDGGTPTEAFLLIGGEVSFDWNRSSKETDESSKDDGYLAATGYASQQIQFSVNGKLKLPDAGLQRASAVSKLTPPKCNLKIVKGSTVKYQGQVAIGNFSATFPNDDVCTWKFDMKACAVPTVDDIGA